MAFRSLGLRAALVGAAALGGAATALAQPAAPAPAPAPRAAASAPAPWPYQQDRINEELRAQRFAVDRLLKTTGDSVSPADAAQIEKFFKEYELPRFTQRDEQANLPELRASLKEKFRFANRNPAIKELLNRVIGEYMWGKVTSNRTDPVVRVNAMLVIGDLNDPQDREGARPWLNALKQLTDVAAAQNAPDAIRVAAMVGLKRHAAVPNRTEASAQAIAAPMLVLAKQKEPPSGRSSEGHQWMRRLAMEVLRELKFPGSGGTVARELTAIAANDKESLEVRGSAIDALATIPFTPEQVDVARLAAVMGQISVAATERELAAAPGASRSYSARRLASRLAPLEKGFLAISGKGAMQQQDFVQLVDRYAQAMQREARDKFKTPEEQRVNLGKLTGGLRGVLAQAGYNLQAPPEPAEPAPVEAAPPVETAPPVEAAAAAAPVALDAP